MPRKRTATYEPGDEPWRCCAKAKSTQKRCREEVVPGRNVCWRHGGLGGRPGGGRWSQALGRLGAVLDKVRDDPELTDLERPLSVLSLVVEERMKRVDDGDTPQFRERARELYDQARELSSTDPAGAAAAMTELGKLLREGIKHDKALDSLVAGVDKYRRALEEFWKIRLARQHVINEKDMISILARVAQFAREEMGEDGSARFLRRLDRELLVRSQAKPEHRHAG